MQLGRQGPLVSADQVWGHLLIRAWTAEREEACGEYFQPLTRSEWHGDRIQEILTCSHLLRCLVRGPDVLLFWKICILLVNLHGADMAL